MSETARHYCRRCRSKLSAAVENLRDAFCCRGCYRQHYHSRCLVCEREMTRTTGNQRLCGRRKCKVGFEGLKAHFALGRCHGRSGLRGCFGFAWPRSLKTPGLAGFAPMDSVPVISPRASDQADAGAEQDRRRCRDNGVPPGRTRHRPLLTHQ
jgi:hypothetical protein